ncbi:MAG: diacylglycerol kinase family protein [Candidatus Melainabacteria bacterium]|nr:diacylglycerol kinase family protein [Candidatus Melainabacteria bacterium]
MQNYDVVIIANLKGGSANMSTVDGLCAHLSRRDRTVTVLPTTPEPGSAMKLAREAVAGGAQLVIAFGGDGTVCQVAEGLIGTDTAMAAYPAGTGNLFARTYYSRLAPELFVNMVLDGTAQGVDMIRLDYVDIHGVQHNRLFMTALGLGPLSDATLVSQDVKRIFGKLAYVFGVGKAALNLKPVHFELTLDDKGLTRERKVQAAVVVIANVLPPNMSLFSRGCNASDGLMDTAYLAARNVLDLIPSVGWLPLGCPERSRFYGRVRTGCLKIKTNVPVIPNVDGDASPATTELSLKVVPGAVKMVLI